MNYVELHSYHWECRRDALSTKDRVFHEEALKLLAPLCAKQNVEDLNPIQVLRAEWAEQAQALTGRALDSIGKSAGVYRVDGETDISFRVRVRWALLCLLPANNPRRVAAAREWDQFFADSPAPPVRHSP